MKVFCLLFCGELASLKLFRRRQCKVVDDANVGHRLILSQLGLLPNVTVRDGRGEDRGGSFVYPRHSERFKGQGALISLSGRLVGPGGGLDWSH